MIPIERRRPRGIAVVFVEQQRRQGGHSTGVAVRGADRILRVVPSPAPLGLRPRTRADDPERDGSTDDVRLVEALRAREPRATSALIERHGPHLRRVLFRVLGTHEGECQEALQEVITRAWEGIDRLEDPRALKAWLTRIAVFTARGLLRSKRRRRWLVFFEDVPEPETAWAGPEMQEAARCVYRIFERIPTDERIPFALRMLEGLDLDATADACGMSLATVRRRLVRAERRFFKLARQYEALEPWLETRR
jgi:RNA polymerase sigma-70 factor, ECF subfamily